MVKISILPAVLISARFISTGLAQDEENQVAWLRDVQNDESVSLAEIETLNDDSQVAEDVIPANENIVALVNDSISSDIEQRDPRRRPFRNRNMTNNNKDSGVGRIDISVPLSLGVGVTIMVAFLQH
ncbi:uncharacterized protein F4822DRAFT_360580 [Hypoxylon trugodes]|uniref:uncharacterized protein n=1 Tax=Hypoxylon trugodes TaxID=326681 RepID=UPI00218CE6B3|nr:uncharacterized protein F4822DRAFT_360580 [Hypoxylon trugodes]KAI1386025.1 hypothetical protein F4822DRAFT_360580 [Hypoxylon trugodes]